MRVIARSRLVRFWESRKHDSEAVERDLSAWYKLAKSADWTNFAALRQTFGSADQVGNCVGFDVGNNRFRLIGRVNYVARRLYVQKVMDRVDYDKQRWIDQCGCHEPPPRKPATPRTPAAPGKSPPKGKVPIRKPRGGK